MSTEGSDSLTVTSVARAAGVSAPTAYRYFPSREALLAALAEWIQQRLGKQTYPASLEEAPDFARKLFRGFDDAESLCRAQLNTPAGREVRRVVQRRRHQAIRQAVDGTFAELPPHVRTGLAAVAQSLVSLPTWLAMKDYWGLSSPLSGEWIAWALEALRRAARERPQSLPGARPSPAGRL